MSRKWLIGWLLQVLFTQTLWGEELNDSTLNTDEKKNASLQSEAAASFDIVPATDRHPERGSFFHPSCNLIGRYGLTLNRLIYILL